MDPESLLRMCCIKRPCRAVRAAGDKPPPALHTLLSKTFSGVNSAKEYYILTLRLRGQRNTAAVSASAAPTPTNSLILSVVWPVRLIGP